MNTSRSSVRDGVSFKYFCHTWIATSCAEDLFDRVGLVLDTGFEAVCAGADTGAPVVLVVVDCATGFDVAGCAGFLAILKRARTMLRLLCRRRGLVVLLQGVRV